MATAASPGALVSPVVHDRKFYTGMAIVMLFTALVGFSRSYFLGLGMRQPSPAAFRTQPCTSTRCCSCRG